jgi:hypothetical protein
MWKSSQGDSTSVINHTLKPRQWDCKAKLSTLTMNLCQSETSTFVHFHRVSRKILPQLWNSNHCGDANPKTSLNSNSVSTFFVTTVLRMEYSCMPFCLMTIGLWDVLANPLKFTLGIYEINGKLTTGRWKWQNKIRLHVWYLRNLTTPPPSMCGCVCFHSGR